MPTACIIRENARVNLSSESLQVTVFDPDKGKNTNLRSIQIRDVDRIIIGESTQLSSAAQARLLRQQIPIAILSHGGRFLGATHPPVPAHGHFRRHLYQRTTEGEYSAHITRTLLHAKLYNQRRCIQRIKLARKQADKITPDQITDIDATITWLGHMMDKLHKTSAVDELRGYEGAATARYFQTWAAFLPAAFPFEKRTRRPPLNPVNACLSYGSSLLYGETTALLWAHGIDPAAGFLHTVENGRWSLALDLMEPFRPCIIEALTLDLFSRSILDQECFQPHNNGIHLNSHGRPKFHLQYEKRLQRQFHSEATQTRTNLRSEIERTITTFKSSITKPEIFSPFRMN